MTFTCDGCDRELTGGRVVFTTEATDERGVDVIVTKRWVVCPNCADTVFTRIGEPSPWSDEDFKTLVYPDDDDVAAPVGGFRGSF